MGIALGDLVVKQPTQLADWTGKWIAFDAWNILYQFLSSVRQRDGTPLMNEAGQVTSHLAGVLYRTSNLVEAGIKPVWVFDGPPHPLKAETLAGRAERKRQAQVDYEAAVEAGDAETAASKAKQTSKLTHPMAEEAMELLEALGMPTVKAPSEGEAQAAWMCSEGIVDAACSQDFDSLLFGAPTLLRNLTVSGRRKLPGKQVWVQVAPERIDLEASLAGVELTRDQLIDAALLVGTDFHPGIKGIGPKKAVAMIAKDGSLDALLDRLTTDPGSASAAVERAVIDQQDALMDRVAVRELFTNPPHVDCAPEVSAPDVAQVRSIMVDRFGFDQGRVDAAVAKFEAARGRQSQKGLFDF